jgi:hypothetical protein
MPPAPIVTDAVVETEEMSRLTTHTCPPIPPLAPLPLWLFCLPPAAPLPPPPIARTQAPVAPVGFVHVPFAVNELTLMDAIDAQDGSPDTDFSARPLLPIASLASVFAAEAYKISPAEERTDFSLDSNAAAFKPFDCRKRFAAEVPEFIKDESTDDETIFDDVIEPSTI